jgi:hypothetical protein
MASTMTKKSYLPDCKVLAELSQRCESESRCVRLDAENRPSAGTSQVLPTPATEICWQRPQATERQSWQKRRESAQIKSLISHAIHCRWLASHLHAQTDSKMGEIAASRGLVMGWLVVPRHVCWSFRQMLSRPGDIQAFAATNHRWGGRECETEEGRASYVPFQCLPFSEPKQGHKNRLETGQHRSTVCFSGGDS